MYLSSVFVVEVKSLFADHRMTEQLLRVSATLKYSRHIEFINLNPGLSQMSSFHMQKHGRWKAKGRPARDTELSVIAELQRAKRASEAPWVRKIGNPSSQENLVMTSAYKRANVRPYVRPSRLWGRGRGVSRSSSPSPIRETKAWFSYAADLPGT